MRYVAMLAIVLTLLAGTAMAAQPGQVSNSTLAKLGLSNLHQMTDTQGQSIRGTGFASVSGTSAAVIILGHNGTGTTSGPNNYTATSSTGAGTSALAAGATISIAGGGFLFNPPNGGPPVSAVGGLFAAGGSVAYAK